MASTRTPWKRLQHVIVAEPSTSSAEKTEERVAHHKKEADPRRRMPRRTQATPPRRTQRVTPPPLVRKSEQGFHLEICGDMKERHDNASNKGNGAHERRHRRTGPRHGKAFTHTSTPTSMAT
uniref:Uncharacterized protein n=1 Tax=Oryza meridionalis TaxID=40149 RepID=A0A0E0EQF1_9ORYZ